ncbi:titin homolog [Dendronephthya gigantea]|uniref:titin homolog n=1 Tax=Dendronephthya gigantea TaxID=151771 RepID=UPI00106C3987|nr:titin homolog [Dendronephthya gigantea]
MAVSHVLIQILQIYIVFFNKFYGISSMKCADINCKAPISVATAVDDYESTDENYISFKKGDKIFIFSKYVEVDNSIWKGSLNGASPGLLRRDLLRESKILIGDDKLVELASNNLVESASNKLVELASDNKVNLHGKQPVASQQPSDELGRQNADEQSQDSLKSPVNDANNEDTNKVASKATENERTAQFPAEILEGGSSHLKSLDDDPNGNQDLDNENNDQQIVGEASDTDGTDGVPRREVYTNPDGVQYDVKIEYMDPSNEKSYVEVVDVTKEEQSHVLDNVNEENQGQGRDDGESTGKEKTGFLSSVRHLVSDFADNIVKDFQGEENKNDKEINVEQGEHKENLESKQTLGKPEMKEDTPPGSTDDELNKKPSEFKGFQSKFEQMKAARLERMKESMAADDTSIPRAEDEEEVLRKQAKKTVEDIPGLIKESKEELEDKVAGDKLKDKETTAGKKVGESESQEPPSKSYSDKVLCSSVAINDREVCMESGSKEQCLQDNCCFDETAAPGKQCFFKPSAPESGFTDEELQKFKEKEKPEAEKESTAQTDGNTSKSSEVKTSTISEEDNKEISGEANEGDSGTDNTKKLAGDDQGGDGDEDVAKNTETEPEQETEREVEREVKQPLAGNDDGQTEGSDVDNGHEDGDKVAPTNVKKVVTEKEERSETDDTSTKNNLKTVSHSEDDSSNKDKANVDAKESSDASAEPSVRHGKVSVNDAGTHNERRESLQKSMANDEDTASVRSAHDSGKDLSSSQDANGEGDQDDQEVKHDEGLKEVVQDRKEDASEMEKEMKDDIDEKDDMEKEVVKDETGVEEEDGAEVEAEDSMEEEDEEEPGEEVDEDVSEGGEPVKPKENFEVKSSLNKKEDETEDKIRVDKEEDASEGGESVKPKDLEVENSLGEKEDKTDVDKTGDGVDSADDTNLKEDQEEKESITHQVKEEGSHEEADSHENKDKQQETGTPQQDGDLGANTADSQNNLTNTGASSPDEKSEQDEEDLHKQSVGEKAEHRPDAEGIFASIRNLLPGGGSKDDTESEEKTTCDASTLDKAKDSDKESDGKISPENEEDDKTGEHDLKKDVEEQIDKDTQFDVEKIFAGVETLLPRADTEKDEQDESSEDGKDKKEDETRVNSESLQMDNKTKPTIASDDSSIKASGEGQDEGKTSEPRLVKSLKDVPDDESSVVKDTGSDTDVPSTRVVTEEKTADSGSTLFQNNTGTKVSLEKTTTSTVETTTEIRETDKEDEGSKAESKEGNEGATVGNNETTVEGKVVSSGVEEIRSEPDVIPTKTTPVETPGTMATGHKAFEKKFPNIASKWMKNKLAKGKRMAGKGTEDEGSGDRKIDGNLDPGKVEDIQEPETKDNKDLHSGTCSKDGTCDGTDTFSSSIHRSILENDGEDDAIFEPGPPPDDVPEGKSVKTRFLETLGVAVRKFKEYHTIVAGYGLQMMKPLKNIVKSLGEQIGLGETIEHVEHELKHGPQGVVALTFIMIAITTYFMFSVLCGSKVPPAYGPNLKDVFKTYEGRIRILEEECSGYEERIENLNKKANDDCENSSELQKHLDDEKHERNKAEEQIAILKEIVQNMKEKVELLEEESSKLKQSLVQKTERIDAMEEELSVKSQENETAGENIKVLEEQLKEKDEEKVVLNDNIEDYKQQLSKAEDDTDRHKTMLQDWNDRYHELQQKYDDVSVNNQTLQEQIHFKDNEIEVLRDSLIQINGNIHVNSDEELSQEEMQEARSEKFKELMDVSQIRTDYKLCKEEKEKLEDDVKAEVDKREKLEGEVEQLEIDLAKSKASEEEIRFKYREADIKLNALQDYFKNMESDLHRKLTAEEAARLASESELERKLREASTAVQDVELYRKQVDELRKEIDETQQAFRSQISSTEERAHENWLKFRTAERELEEIKRERDALRRRLYDVETSSKATTPLEESSSLPGTETQESPRPESPATSVRSSKRKNSNPRKSPSGSPLEERKDRVRRKTRDRNSPLSWNPDVGPPPRRRDKDRETPPPPPLWDPNMGPRRRGQRDSPGMDAERRQRDRYTPSPPPPPDAVIQSSRRRRRDRPTPSSSPPPPPPPGHMLSPRGMGPPTERPPPNIPMRGGPPRMISQPVGGGMRGPLENTPPSGYARGGGQGGPMATGMQRKPPNTGISPGAAVPPTKISPLRGVQPQGISPNEQSTQFVNNSLQNISPRGDSEQPPPPPLFASNGPYPRPPPRKIQTQPS